MLGVLYGLVALLLCLSGVFIAFEYRSYTEDQRARAPLLSRAYLASGVVLCLVGIGSIVWLLSGRSVWTASGVGSVAAALPCFVQYLLSRRADIERSPLADRLNSTVARKLNVPEY